MMYRLLFSLLLTLKVSPVCAQEIDTNAQDQFEYDSLMISEDLGLKDTIDLDASVTYAVKFNSDLEKRYFYWLRKRVRDVWPYVLEGVKEYYFVKDSAKQISDKRARKKFIKRRNNELADKFEDDLKDLSTSRGQILSKFIHRETGSTAHEIIKELRGGFKAFLWNTAGKAFDIDLKVMFNPKKTREDLYLEVILQQEFAKERLVPSDEYLYELDE